jgi:RNA polymerase sigma factor FliA
MSAHRNTQDSAAALADDGETALWRAWIQGRDAAARERLLERHLPYARVVAATYYARRTHEEIEFEEYLQLARVGLLESFDRYDPALGAQFKTFAARRMQGAILSGLERLTEKNQQIAVRREAQRDRLQAAKNAASEKLSENLIRHEGMAGPAGGKKSEQLLFSYLAEVGIGLALGVMLEGTGMIEPEEVDGAATAASAEVTYFQKSEIQRLRDSLRTLVARLSEQERTVIRCHYLQDISFDEIGRMLGVKRSRVSQIHQQALKNLRQGLAPDACDVFA